MRCVVRLSELLFVGDVGVCQNVRVAVCGGCWRLSYPLKGPARRAALARRGRTAQSHVMIQQLQDSPEPCNHAMVQTHVYFTTSRIAPTSGRPPCAAARCALRLIQPAPSRQRARAPSWARAAAGQRSTRAAARAARASRRPRRARQRAAAAAPLDPAAGQRPRCAQPGRGGAGGGRPRAGGGARGRPGGGAAVGRVVGQEAARADNAPAPPQPLQARTRSGQGRCRGDYQITLRCMCRCSYARRL